MTRLDHLLTIAGEECAEIAQRLSKAQRFGLDEIQMDAVENPHGHTNRERVMREYYDLRAVLGMIGLDAWDRSPRAARFEADKVAKVEHYLAYSREQGRLD